MIDGLSEGGVDWQIDPFPSFKRSRWKIAKFIAIGKWKDQKPDPFLMTFESAVVKYISSISNSTFNTFIGNNSWRVYTWVLKEDVCLSLEIVRKRAWKF